MLVCQMSLSLGSSAFADVAGREACVYSLLIAIEEVEEVSGLALALVDLAAQSLVQ